jgi:RNA polymerase sigma factor (sigma-70 family)
MWLKAVARLRTLTVNYANLDSVVSIFDRISFPASKLVVRNTFYVWLRQRSVQPVLTDDGEMDDTAGSIPDPESALIQNADRNTLRAALEDLAVEFREAIVLREMEGLTYKEIADIAGVPIGTVMSRLARARKRLQIYLANTASENCL